MDKDELLQMGLDEENAEKILLERRELEAEYEGRIEQIKRENEIENLLKESGAKNIKAVRALLEEDDTQSIAEQIEKLKKGEDTGFLFAKNKGFSPARSGERLPDTTKSSYEAKLFEARRSGNTIEAIRIKQMAANEGIMLL